MFWLQSNERIILIGGNTLTEREVISYYFHCGYDYKAIVHLLKTHWDISLSKRTLKRRLQKYNLRKNSNIDDSVLRTIRDSITVYPIQGNMAFTKKIIQC